MYLGDFKEDSTVNFMFTTQSEANGGALAPNSAFEAADLRIYKNASATQKATDNGVTMTSPFDSVTGLHHVSIDTSVDTGDTGFWDAGNDYICVMAPDETVDSQTWNRVVAHFSLENRAFSRGGPVVSTPVAEEFTVTVPSRSSTNLAAATTYYVQPNEKVLMAFDFVNVLHEGDTVSEFVTLTEDASQSITLTKIGVCGSQAKFWVENTVASLTYRIEGKVTTSFGLTLEGDFVLQTAD